MVRTRYEPHWYHVPTIPYHTSASAFTLMSKFAIWFLHIYGKCISVQQTITGSYSRKIEGEKHNTFDACCCFSFSFRFSSLVFLGRWGFIYSTSFSTTDGTLNTFLVWRTVNMASMTKAKAFTTLCDSRFCLHARQFSFTRRRLLFDPQRLWTAAAKCRESFSRHLGGFSLGVYSKKWGTIILRLKMIMTVGDPVVAMFRRRVHVSIHVWCDHHRVTSRLPGCSEYLIVVVVAAIPEGYHMLLMGIESNHGVRNIGSSRKLQILLGRTMIDWLWGWYTANLLRPQNGESTKRCVPTISKLSISTAMDCWTLSLFRRLCVLRVCKQGFIKQNEKIAWDCLVTRQRTHPSEVFAEWRWWMTIKMAGTISSCWRVARFCFIQRQNF